MADIPKLSVESRERLIESLCKLLHPAFSRSGPSSSPMSLPLYDEDYDKCLDHWKGSSDAMLVAEYRRVKAQADQRKEDEKGAKDFVDNLIYGIEQTPVAGTDFTLPQAVASDAPASRKPDRVTPAKGCAGDTATEAKWKTEAVALAMIYIKAWRDAGYEPTKKDAALYVEGELSTSGIYGERKEVLDAAYIERWALEGITGRSPGAKSKKPKVPEGSRGKLPKIK